MLSKTTLELPCTNARLEEPLAVKVLICVNTPLGIEAAEVIALMLFIIIFN